MLLFYKQPLPIPYPHSIPRVVPSCHRTLASICPQHQGDRGHLCGLQPEQEPDSEGLCL